MELLNTIYIDTLEKELDLNLNSNIYFLHATVQCRKEIIRLCWTKVLMTQYTCNDFFYHLPTEST